MRSKIVLLVLSVVLAATVFAGPNDPFVDTASVTAAWTTVCDVGSSGYSNITMAVHNTGVNALTACRVQTFVGPASADVAATGVLTLTGLPLNTETVTLDTKAYIFQDTLTDVDGNVKIGSDESESLDNFIAAITGGAGSGTAYAASMTTHTSVTAAAGVGDTMGVTALAVGSAGNAIASTHTLTNGSFAAGTLVGGADSWTTISSTWSDCASLAAGASTAWAVSGSSYVRLRVQAQSTSGTSAHCRQNRGGS
jgi:hypothetical protein